MSQIDADIFESLPSDINNELIEAYQMTTAANSRVAPASVQQSISGKQQPRPILGKRKQVAPKSRTVTSDPKQRKLSHFVEHAVCCLFRQLFEDQEPNNDWTRIECSSGQLLHSYPSAHPNHIVEWSTEVRAECRSCHWSLWPDDSLPWPSPSPMPPIYSETASIRWERHSWTTKSQSHYDFWTGTTQLWCHAVCPLGR